MGVDFLQLLDEVIEILNRNSHMREQKTPFSIYLVTGDEADLNKIEELFGLREKTKTVREKIIESLKSRQLNL